jgi:hypothetical protein
MSAGQLFGSQPPLAQSLSAPSHVPPPALQLVSYISIQAPSVPMQQAPFDGRGISLKTSPPKSQMYISPAASLPKPEIELIEPKSGESSAVRSW